MAVFRIIYIAAMVIFLFGLTVFAHEFGHFIVARLSGMVVEVFSIGFGPALWKRRIRGVTYKIGFLPLGGYVALPQMDSEPKAAAQPDGGADGESAAGPPPPAPPLAKIAVAFAGGLGNMALAVALAWVVYLTGKPSTPAERNARIGYVDTNSAAFAAGIRTGDEILRVQDQPVSNWYDVVRVAMGAGQVRLLVKTSAGDRLFDVPAKKDSYGIHRLDGLEPVTLCRVAGVVPGSAAEEAGIRMGDTILSFDGVEMLSFDHLSMMIRVRPGIETPLTLRRDGAVLDLRVTPRMSSELGYAVIGVRWDPRAVEYDQLVHIPPGRQIREHVSSIVALLARLFTPKHAVETSRGLAGPVFIFYYFVEFVRQGLPLALWFTVFINVNLAIVNLLPIPVLDGGHIVFALWELLSRRRVHPLVIQWATNVFAGLLILAVVLLTGRDAMRLGADQLWRRLAGPAQTNVAPAVEAPAAQEP